MKTTEMYLFSLYDVTKGYHIIDDKYLPMKDYIKHIITIKRRIDKPY